MDNLFNFAKESDDEHWISVSDLMAGLMIIFLFIAISLITVIAENSVEVENRIQESLKEKFKEELENPNAKWRAELKGLTLRFKELEGDVPVVFFKPREHKIEEEFEKILDDFIPRYLEVLNQYKDRIAEVRIEGHTSSEWTADTSDEDAYLNNMELSQNRTRAVLKYALQNTGMSEYDKAWLQPKLTANGLSSSELIKTNGKENKTASRRVEFEVRINPIKEISNFFGKDDGTQ